MKFKDFKSFRDYDRKFVKATNVSKKILKDLGIEKLEEPIYGILYIDSQCGATLRILGDKHTEIKDELLVLRCDQGIESFNEIDFEVFEGTDYLKEVLENQIYEFYYNDEIIELLSDNTIDEFRHDAFPNDVEVILPDGENPERMWASLILKIKEDNVYIGKLLNTSYYDENYKIGEHVALTLYEEDDFRALVINGIVKIKESNN